MSPERIPAPVLYEAPVTHERVALPYTDDVLRYAIADEQGSNALFQQDPVLWTRTAVGILAGREPSSVPDEELAGQYFEGNFTEWDPRVVQILTDHLQAQGLLAA